MHTHNEDLIAIVYRNNGISSGTAKQLSNLSVIELPGMICFVVKGHAPSTKQRQYNLEHRLESVALSNAE
jgi:hypothetical protein